MFPFQKSCELSFQISNKASDDQHNYDPEIEHDLLKSDFSFDSVGKSDSFIINLNDNSINNSSKSGRKGGRQRLSATGSTSGDGGTACDSNYKKRVIHREIERKRRQEMATLYSSLRTLLPVDYIKGKRSISDHTMEAANYIKHLERNVKQLKEKREKLKASEEDDVVEPGNRSSPDEDVSIIVERFSQGLEIKIITSAFDHREEGFPLSRAVAVILEQGLDVFSCVSTRVNHRWIHVIHSEVNSMLSTNPSWLRERLLDEIRSTINDP